MDPERQVRPEREVQPRARTGPPHEGCVASRPIDLAGDREPIGGDLDEHDRRTRVSAGQDGGTDSVDETRPAG